MKTAAIALWCAVVFSWIGYSFGWSAEHEAQRAFRRSFSVCVDTVCETDFDHIQHLGLQAFIDSVDIPNATVTIQNIEFSGHVLEKD